MGTLTGMGWDGTNKNWASPKKLSPGGWGAVRLIR